MSLCAIIVFMSGEPELQSRGERNRGSPGVGHERCSDSCGEADYTSPAGAPDPSDGLRGGTG